MTPKLLLLITISYSISIGFFFGWKKSLKGFAFWGLLGAALIEVAASDWGFNGGMFDTAFKQVLIIFGLGLPVFALLRHASLWKDECKRIPSSSKKQKSASRYAIQLLPALNLALPALGLGVGSALTLIARKKAQAYVPQLRDTLIFQAYWSFMLFASYIFSSMPIGIYASFVVIIYGAGKILVGLAVLKAGVDYRFCNTEGGLSRVIRSFREKRLTKAGQGL